MSPVTATRRLPAILGGPPAFPSPLPFNQPTLPPFSRLRDRFTRMLRSGTITKGPVLLQYEAAVREHLGVREAVGVSSCTMGLILVLQALKARLPATRTEVILPSFTFPATAHAVIWNGLVPVYADCNPETFLLDPRSVEAAITERTAGILAVHTFGSPAPFDPLEALAKPHGLFLIFDAAHAFGSLENAHPVGSAGTAQVFSTSPTKLLATGEGGIMATNDPELAEKIRVAREYGNPGDYNCVVAGMNGRLSELHALLGLEGLKDLPKNAERRQELAQLYRDRLAGLPLRFQTIPEGTRSSFKDIAVLVEPDFGLSREELKAALAAEGIPTRAYFDPPLHRQIFSDGAARAPVPLPHTELVASRVLCLPIFSHMPPSIAARIGSRMRSLYRHRKAVAERLAKR